MTIAEPIAPGRGLPVYQPATVVEPGTWIAPPLSSPSVISLVFTPISGMVRETGPATGFGGADCGGATIGPVGAGNAPTPAATGRMAGVECRVRSKPALPPMTTTRPAAKKIAAGLRFSFITLRCSSADADLYGAGPA